jgi:hypothetical protein
MVHSGYEASGVNYTFGSMKGLLETARAIFFDSYPDDGAMKLLNEWKPAHTAPLVQIADGVGAANETSSELQGVSGD